MTTGQQPPPMLGTLPPITSFHLFHADDTGYLLVRTHHLVFDVGRNQPGTADAIGF